MPVYRVFVVTDKNNDRFRVFTIWTHPESAVSFFYFRFHLSESSIILFTYFVIQIACVFFFCFDKYSSKCEILMTYNSAVSGTIHYKKFKNFHKIRRKIAYFYVGSRIRNAHALH